MSTLTAKQHDGKTLTDITSEEEDDELAREKTGGDPHVAASRQ